MRASKAIYHPNGNADTFKTVEETLDALQFGDDAKIGGSTGDTDNTLVRSDGTAGKTVQSTGIAVDDSDNVSGIGTLSCGDITSSGFEINSLKTYGETFTISQPEDQDYDALIDATFGFTISSITSKCRSGTCNATFKIGGTALGGTANSVSSTKDAQEHTSDNEVEIGDDLTCTISSNSSCIDAIFTIKFTRT